MATPFNYGAVAREGKEVEEYEDPPEVVALRRLRQKFIRDIVPSHIIPCLKTCLTRPEEEEILAQEGNKGPIRGAMILIDFLMKKDRDHWYETLLVALRDEDVKLSHLASDLEKEFLTCKEEEKRPNCSRSATFGASYAEGPTDTGLQSAHIPPSTSAVTTPAGTRVVPGFINVTDLEAAMKDVRLTVAGSAPVEQPPPYTAGTYFEDGGRLVPSAGGNPEQDKPLTLNQYFVNVSVGTGSTVQVGSGNTLIPKATETEQPTDVEKSSKSGEKDDVSQSENTDDEDCIIEGEIIEDDEEDGLMSEYHKEEKNGQAKKSAVTMETRDVREARAAADVGRTREDVQSTEDQTSDGTVSSSASTSQSDTKPKLKYEKLEMRGYQEELAQPALKGNNCIICAPTGTGKTHVAMRIAKHHMDLALAEEARLSDADAGDTSSQLKVIFLVHRIPLLNQTYKRFKQYFPLLKIAKRSGASLSTTGFEILVAVNDVVVTTGGILKNSLDDKKVSLDKFSLIIIDECHHATKNHPYNVIMTEYLRLKLANPALQLPQIVGLTASPGSGSKSGLSAARDHILKLCANLDAHAFVTVQDEKNKEELRSVTNDPDKYTKIPDARNPDPFKEKVEEIMVEIEKKAGLSGGFQRGTQKYETFIIEALKSATSGNRHEEAKCCEHLREYNTALQMSSLCRMTDALDIIEGFYSERLQRGQHKTTEIEKWLYKQFKRNCSYLYDISEEEEKYSNPKVDALKSVLKEEINQNGQNLRGIIFVKTRKLAKAVCDSIKDDKLLTVLNPAIVTGVQAKDDGMSQSVQDTALKRFSKGEHKLLVATSVVEEGLDIPECHLVIRYNYATNEISMRQSRGRARAKESKVHFIGDDETASKDKVNVLLDQQVEKATDLVQQMPIDEFLHEIRDIQPKVVADRCDQELKQNLKKSANAADSIKLFCRGCSKYICKGSHVYKFDCNHFIRDKDIVEGNFEFREHTKENKRDLGILKIYCKSCKQDWGIATPPQHFPVIKISSFIVEYANGDRKMKKKWKDTEFQPEIVERLPFPKFKFEVVYNTEIN